ncbi:C-Jun-amino-terminal kinase-interacting protein 4 isoform X2 [Bombina bombina]|uniref:C-Jun-amino-terminal kinase-interacting protein 4 isoform X2 n=1 Tax=Bombina bombina TaxID=8345 RepID=UPI00235A7F24|nr:C-Jun-amino-terminal kinase-interacting protein 4 isoform X2 [Bombina bombina]
MELEDGVVYQEDPGNSAVMSERVSGLASSIYREFERLIGKYDEDVVKELMPLVVAVLENLDAVFAENQEHEVELELLKEDNEQLITQYEREKALRKHAEEKFIEFEDSQEQDKKDLQIRVENLESQTRQLELKAKNYADQISRLEEREAELKKEYNSLHQRHSEMIHNYMEHLERSKLHQLIGSDQLESTIHSKIRKDRPIALGIFPLAAGDSLVLPDAHGTETLGNGPWKLQDQSNTRCNTSLKDELQNISQAVSKTGTTDSDNMVHTSLKDNKDEVIMKANIKNNNVHKNNKSADVQVAQETRTTSTGTNGNDEKSEVQSIIESTPELDMGKDPKGFHLTRLSPTEEATSIVSLKQETLVETIRSGSCITPTKGIENIAFDRNTESLFEELSSAGTDLIADVDEGADLLGMGREVENLILENTQLLETKNALNVVKNDLIAKVDELACEKDVLQGELLAIKQAKQKLEEKNKELEEELKKARAEAEEARQKAKDDEDSDVPTAQRKRFTRVEMARVLMERNQYKERLMELQEAVRWTEMIRASRENPAMQEKKRSSIWQFFSRLFSSSNTASKKPELPVNLKYNAPTSHITPTVKKRSSALSKLPSDKSKAFDFLSDDLSAGSEATLASRREQKREQYRQVKAHVQKEDGRVQAFGWSLPQKYKPVTNGGQNENKMKNLPVPVYLRPLDEKDTSMKLWCAVGVNLSGGKTRDGGSIIGASVFYSDIPGAEDDSQKQRSESQSSIEKLEHELKLQQKELRHQDELSSLVWICTSTHSSTKVIIVDANDPGNMLDSFIVCNSHVLCIASVPGAMETDYPAGETSKQESEACHADKSLSESLISSSSSVSDNVAGSVKVGGCPSADDVDVSLMQASKMVSSEEAPKPDAVAESNETEDNVLTAEEATEATEVGDGSGDDVADVAQTGIYTEHVFTDPLGVQNTEEPLGSQASDSDLYKDGIATLPTEQDLMREEAQKMNSLLPTMWLGAQNGCLYVHSSVAQWKKCLHSIKLKDSILSIVHVKGIVLVALADGTLAIFHRGVDGQWDLTNYHLLDFGRPHHSIRCMTVVHEKVWCGYRNKIYIVQPKAMKIEKSFDAHPRKESQVRQLAWIGDGVWVSIRLDSTLRLYHAHTYQHLQDVDIEPYVSKMLGTGKLGFSFVRITALMVSCNRLWVGTGNGVIISIPLTETNKTVPGTGSRPGSVIRVYGDENSDKVTPGTFIPYCSMAHAQLCFHGHRDAVKFFVAVPGQVLFPSSSSSSDLSGEKGALYQQEQANQNHQKSMLVMSGGEGYIDFRMGDDSGESEILGDSLQFESSVAKVERSHLIVWQVMCSNE